MLSLNKSCKSRKVSLTIHCKYKYFDSTVQRAEDRRQKFYFNRLPFAVNVKFISSLMFGIDCRRYLFSPPPPPSRSPPSHLFQIFCSPQAFLSPFRFFARLFDLGLEKERERLLRRLLEAENLGVV